MMSLPKTLLPGLWLLLALGLGAMEVEYTVLDLSDQDRVLFRADVLEEGQLSYGSVFAARLEDGVIEPLSYYPENARYIGGTRQLEIQNRFGLYRIALDGSPVQTLSLSAFHRGQPAAGGRLLPVNSTRDGRYIVEWEPRSQTRGDLVVRDLLEDRSHTLSRNNLLDFSSIPGIWSPDQRILIYEKDGSLYYFSLRHWEEGRIADESLRSVGQGFLNSVSWNDRGELYLVQDRWLYRILPEEIFTIGLYRGLFRAGGALGRIPFPFDSRQDRFWVSPDGSRILLSQGGRTLIHYHFQQNAGQSLADLGPATYLSLGIRHRIHRVLWNSDQSFSLVVRAPVTEESGGSRILAFDALGRARSTGLDRDDYLDWISQEQQGLVSGAEFSLLLEAQGVKIRRNSNGSILAQVPHPDLRFAFWAGSRELVLAGGGFSALYTLNPQASEAARQVVLSRVLSVGSPQTAGWNEAQDQILFESGGRRFQSPWTNSPGNLAWQVPATGQEQTLRSGQRENSRYRVYSESWSRGFYRNILMYRRLATLENQRLFVPPQEEYDAFPSTEPESRNRPGLLVHGSRLRSRDLALVFNALDSDQDLAPVLDLLEEYGIQATFFFNGEFLRRNPHSAREILRAGHEAASLFYLDFDLLDSRFRIDQDFLRRGLAHVEDQFYQVTGQELRLYWHAPLYRQNELILEAGSSMNYTYVSRDVVSGAEEPQADMEAAVESILDQVQPGSIIPLRLGSQDSVRGEFLSRYLDLLLNNLVKRGYRLVPVSRISENAP